MSEEKPKEKENVKSVNLEHNSSTNLNFSSLFAGKKQGRNQTNKSKTNDKQLSASSKPQKKETKLQISKEKKITTNVVETKVKEKVASVVVIEEQKDSPVAKKSEKVVEFVQEMHDLNQDKGNDQIVSIVENKQEVKHKDHVDEKEMAAKQIDIAQVTPQYSNTQPINTSLPHNNTSLPKDTKAALINTFQTLNNSSVSLETKPPIMEKANSFLLVKKAEEEKKDKERELLHHNLHEGIVVVPRFHHPIDKIVKEPVHKDFIGLGMSKLIDIKHLRSPLATTETEEVLPKKTQVSTNEQLIKTEEDKNLMKSIYGQALSSIHVDEGIDAVPEATHINQFIPKDVKGNGMYFIN